MEPPHATFCNLFSTPMLANVNCRFAALTPNQHMEQFLQHFATFSQLLRLALSSPIPPYARTPHTLPLHLLCNGQRTTDNRPISKQSHQNQIKPTNTLSGASKTAVFSPVAHLDF
jgi:hypothetical protein